MRNYQKIGSGLGALALAGALALVTPNPPTPELRDGAESADSVIVRAATAARAAEAVRRAGGLVTHELDVIDAVAARLTADQRRAVARTGLVDRLFEDHGVAASWWLGDWGSGLDSSGSGSDLFDSTIGYFHHPDTAYPELIRADELQDAGIAGSGVTVAVIDTGLMDHANLEWYGFHRRLLRTYDAIRDEEGYSGRSVDDENGHGSHVAGVIANNAKGEGEWRYNGVAPKADLVAIKAFDAAGRGTYADVIRGIDWAVANKDELGIRVLNLSFSAPVRSFYWDDPLNLAVMEAWRSGIVVVAAASNAGPAPMTVGVPGNVPYVVTVGAMTDNYTLDLKRDDRPTSFSAVGPTYEGFVKPEMVAPGGHVKSLMPLDAVFAEEHPEFHDGGYYFEMSGTSQAAAVVSGLAALLLEEEPWLTPDDVKCRLMAGARAAVRKDGSLKHSVFAQGAGRVDAVRSFKRQTAGCANRGLDVHKDVAGIEHYLGLARIDAEGNIFLLWPDGSAWSDGFAWSEGDLWQSGFAWSEAFPLSEGFAWSENGLVPQGFAWSEGSVLPGGFAWSEGSLVSDGFAWSESGTLAEGFAWSEWNAAEVAVHHWVEPE